MQDLDATAWQFLEKKGVQHCCRMYFRSHVKCDSVDNNMADIFNAFIMDARYMPIVSMLKTMFHSIMKRITVKKKKIGCILKSANNT